jgi:ubiquinone/menaquinone biosynthesis C-methylase UbiE
MSNLEWLEVTHISFNALLLLEPLHVEYLASRQPDAQMGTALKEHPAVEWYLRQTHPPVSEYIDRCLQLAKSNPTLEELRQAEVNVLDSMQDWLIYVLDPTKYDQLEFLNWEDASLLSMADFKDKVVLDIGAGTGRLAFAVAPEASIVYAIEPVANLRRYIWEKREQLGFDNVYPLDGSITKIPLPEDFADIIMAGHMFGEHPEREFNELCRVIRDGGMILLHPGTNVSSEDKAHHFLVSKGFNFDTFEEPGDGLKRKYWKKIHK